MAIDEVKNIYTNKVDKLTKAVALLEQAAANKENRPQNNHQEEESNNSKSEDKEPSPPPKKKQGRRRKPHQHPPLVFIPEERHLKWTGHISLAWLLTQVVRDRKRQLTLRRGKSSSALAQRKCRKIKFPD